MTLLGRVYDLDGLVLQDVDAGCGRCGKRLAEVINDPTRRYPTGRLVCIDCGQLARAV